MPRTYAYHIPEMDCAEEVNQLKRALKPVVASEDDLGFDLMRAKLTVTVADDMPDDRPVRDAIRTTGMRFEPWAKALRDAGKQSFWRRQGRAITALAGSAGVIAGFVLHADAVGFVTALAGEGAPPLPGKVLYVVGAILGLWFVLPKALLSLRHTRPDMNLLMTLAVFGAILLGQWLEAATVSVLFAVSLLLESWSVDRARRAVETLMDLTPQQARVLRRDGDTEEVPADTVGVGTKVRVPAGERIPLDGVVRSGASSVNQAPITGESVPVDVEEGDEVYAGTVNGEGTLDIEVTAPADDTQLARIIRRVEEARSHRARSERWVDRFSRVYTPAMLALAVLVALAGPLLGGGTWSDWVYRALVVLVIACPCALVISTPVSVVAGLTAASRRGVLIKGGVYLEQPARLRAMAFDKTGTITHGEPRVLRHRAFGRLDQQRTLAVAAALERQSTHPLARAIVQYVTGEAAPDAVIPDAEQVKTTAGVGVRGRVHGAAWHIGGLRMVEERGITHEELASAIRVAEGDGDTPVVLLREDEPVLMFSLADRIRTEAADTMVRLREAGVGTLVMLTGDHPRVAQAVASSVEMDDVRAGLLPEQKLEAVRELAAKYDDRVAMVGDGINDAPALAASPLAIAMGAMGSDAAIETADIALMSDDLTRLPWLVRHSRRAMRIIYANVAAALGIKAVFLVLAAVDLATLWMAIAADMGVSLLVTLNALRLLDGRE